MKRLIKYTVTTLVFAALFMVEMLGYVKLKDKSMDNFKAQMSEYYGTEVYAEYYGKSSQLEEPAIVFAPKGSSDAKVAVGEKSSNRFSKTVSFYEVENTAIGYKTIADIGLYQMILIAALCITFIVFIVYARKVATS